MNGHPTMLSNTMALQFGPQMGAGVTGPHSIYMLNWIIRLQALLEVITNQMALALEFLATQQSQMSTAIYRNCLALDYLVAEGRVCRKFN